MASFLSSLGCQYDLEQDLKKRRQTRDINLLRLIQLLGKALHQFPRARRAVPTIRAAESICSCTQETTDLRRSMCFVQSQEAFQLGNSKMQFISPNQTKHPSRQLPLHTRNLNKRGVGTKRGLLSLVPIARQIYSRPSIHH